MKNVSNITRGGILTALSVIALYISSLLPTNKITILAILALIIPIAIIWTNIKTALAIYISTSILGILLIGLRGNVISYIILFGTYGFFKLFIEKLKKLYLEIPLKIIYFNISLVMIYLVVSNLVVDITTLKFKLPITLLILGANIVFLVADFIISLLIHEINEKYLKKLKF
ncbi:putative membrane protein [Clostridium bornimense]|uniref:Putative membrane protein n=1 Tax=Clostridium bornimense TaxID=1216932 RepID=W6RWU7_9CLOT|nr:hypothetical protein [Clostridium bornimense]CDM68109.1 putative membrane protein [Clostridium bornimense]